VRSEGIECELEETGTLDVATESYQLAELREYAELAARHGHTVELLERDAVQALVHSPRWLAGVRTAPDRCVMLNPARLAWGLAAAAERRGAVIAEGSRVRALHRRAGGVRVEVEGGAALEAAHVVVATSAYSGWLRRLVPLFVPVYDYVLVTEPLSPDQREAIGWRGREGMSDAGNQFHYFRQTADHRVLWGGYDAIYHRGNRVTPAHERRPATFELLARHFREAFPQLDGIRFDYRWAGAIDTTTRFTVTFGETMGGRVHYALGYTGLGVGSTRWAAGILRDRLLRPDSPLLDLRFVRSTPFPIPPEPLRTPAVELMRREVIRADEHEGRRSLFLRALDTLGIAYQQLGRHEEAIAEYRRSIAIRPTASALSNLGTCLFFLGRWAESAAAYERAVSLQPDDAVLWLNLGDAFRWKGAPRDSFEQAYGRAVALLEADLALTPRDADRRTSLALALAWSGRHDLARVHADEAIAIEPEGAYVLRQVALVRLAAGETGRALDLLERAVRRGFPAAELARDPELSRLRSEPRFARLLAKPAS